MVYVIELAVRIRYRRRLGKIAYYWHGLARNVISSYAVRYNDKSRKISNVVRLLVRRNGFSQHTEIKRYNKG